MLLFGKMVVTLGRVLAGGTGRERPRAYSQTHCEKRKIMPFV